MWSLWHGSVRGVRFLTWWLRVPGESVPKGWSESCKASYDQEDPEYPFHCILLVKEVTKAHIQGEGCQISPLSEEKNKELVAVIDLP